MAFDVISLDCTNVDISISDNGGHMDIDNIKRLVNRLKTIGTVNENTLIIINHFSHNGNPIQHILEERVCEYGWLVSYEGMIVEI